MEIKNLYRYPGTQPFSIEQADIFFGREETVKMLANFLQLHDVTVLHSKSGLGKSSLLNAGLRPYLDNNEQVKTVYVRFKAYLEDQDTSPTYTTRRNIVSGQFQKTYLDKIINNEPSFWHDVKEQQIISKGALPIVFIFDQFEELFTYPAEQIAEFRDNLAELLYTKVPQRYRDIIRLRQADNSFQLTTEQLEIIYTPPQIKVIFGIRSDKLHYLSQLAGHIPTILSHCFELAPLSRTQAQDAIYNPALSRMEKFESPRFDYTPEAVDRIITFLSEDYTTPIESFQLQIICHALERKIIREQLSQITVNEIGDLQTLITDYYQNQLATIIEPADRKKAQHLIEEGLIFAAEERRVSLYKGQIQNEFNVSDKLLEQLIKTRLLRAERLPDGGEAYELSHDSLVKSILKVKENRQVEQEKELLTQEAQEAKAQEKLARADQAKIRSRSFIITGVALVAIIAGLFFWKRYQAEEMAKRYLADRLIENVDQQIKQLKYAEAFTDLSNIAKYFEKDQAAAKLLEIAYFYNETKKHKEALEVLNTLRSITGLTTKDVALSHIAIQNDIQQLSAYFSVTDSLQTQRYYNSLSQPVKLNGLDVAFNKSETTVFQYLVYCHNENLDLELTGSNWGLQGDFPVVKVDWYEAISYANWLSERAGLIPAYDITKPVLSSDNVQKDILKAHWQVKIDTLANGYRLPFLGEWQAVAAFGQGRLDTIPYTISGVTGLLPSDHLDKGIEETMKAYMWYGRNSKKESTYQPHAVKMLQPNLLGLYDMSGNVWEWCSDPYFESGKLNIYHKIAGGAFNNPDTLCTVFSEDYWFSDFRNEGSVLFSNTIGFRLCRNLGINKKTSLSDRTSEL